MILFSFPGNEEMTKKISLHLNAPIGKAIIRKFPDDETYIKIDSDVKNKYAIIVCTLNKPDEKFLPLYFLCETLKDLGAKGICLLAPYLSYMRQDKRFLSGEGITSNYFVQLISSFADSLITVDPHLHRIKSLSEIYKIKNLCVPAAKNIAQWIKNNLENPIFIGPDSESEQWVSAIAKEANSPFTILEKKRFSDKDVRISIPDLENYQGHVPVLIDDIISTAHTMIEAIKHLKEARMKQPVCIGVHALFADNAYEELKKSGAAMIVTCNTIHHKTNRIDISDVLADSVLEIIKT